jgi:hypothetical protein
MCRQEIKSENVTNDKWITNPLTKRKIKVGGKKHLELIANGILN